jgi:hypothetical protein
MEPDQESKEATKPKSVHRSPSKFNAKERCTAEADVEEALCVFGNRPPHHAAFGNSISVSGCHVSCCVRMEGRYRLGGGWPASTKLGIRLDEVACGSRPFDSGPSRPAVGIQYFLCSSLVFLVMSNQSPKAFKEIVKKAIRALPSALCAVSARLRRIHGVH